MRNLRSLGPATVIAVAVAATIGTAPGPAGAATAHGHLGGGRLSASPVVNSEPGTVPFAITFDPAGRLLIAEAGTNALATFSLGQDGTVTLLDAVGTGQPATRVATDPSQAGMSQPGQGFPGRAGKDNG